MGKRTALTLGLASFIALLAPPPAPAAIVSTSGAVVEVTAPPSVAKNAYVSDTEIRAFDEQQNVTILAPITVDFTEPGSYDSLSELAPTVLPAGTCLQSHFIHFDSTGSLGVRLQGSVTYDTDVLGVIVTDSSLSQSDLVVGVPSTTYPTGVADRGAELSPSPQSGPDIVTLSSDRRTVGVDLKVTTVVNQVRVITECRHIADLALAKTGIPDPVVAGRDVDYQITVTNNGLGSGTGVASPATNVTVVDTIPPSSVFVSASGSGWTCGTFDSELGTVTCTLDDPLGIGSSVSLDVIVTSPSTPPEGGAITNSATVSADQIDPNTADNTGTATTSVVETPGPPTEVSSVPSNASAVVTWSPPASSGSSPIDGYEVDCAATGNPPDTQGASTSGATAAQVTGLTNGTEYVCTVKAHNLYGFGPASEPSAPFAPSDTKAAAIVDPTSGGTVGLNPVESFLGTSGMIQLPPQPTSLLAAPPVVVSASLFGTPGETDPTCGGHKCIGQGIDWSISDPGAFGTIRVTFFESPSLVRHKLLLVFIVPVYKNGVRLPNCLWRTTPPAKYGACVQSRSITRDGGWKITVLANGDDPKGRI